jgi:hypothetical protein
MNNETGKQEVRVLITEYGRGQSHDRPTVIDTHASSGDAWSRTPSPLWTFLCRRKFDTTEKWRPQPSTSQANAITMSVLLFYFDKYKHTLFSSVAVHVCLQRTGASKSLVADLALVLLLRTRRDFGAELAHH